MEDAMRSRLAVVALLVAAPLLARAEGDDNDLRYIRNHQRMVRPILDARRVGTPFASWSRSMLTAVGAQPGSMPVVANYHTLRNVLNQLLTSGEPLTRRQVKAVGKVLAEATRRGRTSSFAERTEIARGYKIPAYRGVQWKYSSFSPPRRPGLLRRFLQRFRR
jgi:hypothetical protein